ncbi:MAG TPA: formate dehydrogenase subunit gamma [Candidatus Binatus sp.]|uniref:formate dehydrogenase subunit gamma n=1 Tax=Candidatus Binatus sp. TaxID=2811406 RepID=UPI002B477F43|nr:formate dehydrogenase subunit gamma [Candidatus Binatus sp.]HKN11666.1 formate dehydrogenase subunit gamma [Candidatus Binatus sp.]
MDARNSRNGGAGFDERAIDEIVAGLADKPGALMPVLHAVNKRLGYIPPEAVPAIARALNLSRAEVHGVISFYHDFRTERPGRKVIRVCRAESCQAMGAVALAAHIQARLGIDFGQTSGNGDFTLEPVYCLGNCACSPAIVVGGDLYGRVNPQRFDEILSRVTSSRSSR